MDRQLLVPKDELLSKCVLRVILGGTHAYLMDLNLLMIWLKKTSVKDIREVCSLDVVTMGGASCSSISIEVVTGESS
ncbi:hypothetical protein Tco_1414962 [Tanacetum coccineum]